QSGKVVGIFDACDPTTFGQNNVSCTRSGGVTFDQFIAQVTQNQKAGGWHFAPAELTVEVGEGFFALNRGGETHTFTEVEHFGGGIIPGLNVLSGNPVEAEECKNLTGADFLAPGQSSDLDVADDEGTELYQCCIHPWMRTVVDKRGEQIPRKCGPPGGARPAPSLRRRGAQRRLERRRHGQREQHEQPG